MALLERVRNATPRLSSWSLTPDGVLVRIAGDWMQALALQRDKHRGGWFPNAWVECLAMRDGPVMQDQRIVNQDEPLWTKADLTQLGPAFFAQARPDPTKLLDTTAAFSGASTAHDSRMILCAAVDTIRRGLLEEARAAVARARRPPSAGCFADDGEGLSPAPEPLSEPSRADRRWLSGKRWRPSTTIEQVLTRSFNG